MSKFPLHDVLKEHQEPLTRMQQYLRDKDRTWDEIESRRKTELKQTLQDWKSGKHAVLVLLEAVETTLGYEHPLQYLVPNAKDPESFKEYLNRGDKKLEPEEFKQARKEHIESYTKQYLNSEFHEAPSVPDTTLSDWIDARLASLEQTRAVDIVDEIVSKIMAYQYHHRDSSEYGKEAMISRLNGLRENEDIDNLVHPNDAHLETDIFEALIPHKARSTYAERDTRDEYRTQEDVELRRSLEIIPILEDWKAGAHPFLVMSDIIDVALGSILDNRLSEIITYAQSKKISEIKYRKEKVTASAQEQLERDNALAYTLWEQEKIRRDAKQVMRSMREEVVAYRGPETHPEFAAEIDNFIEHIQETDERSLSIVQGIAEAIFAPVEDPKSHNIDNFDGDLIEAIFLLNEAPSRDQPLLTQIRHHLAIAQKKEDAVFAATKPMGKLETQTEEEIKAPLSEIFRRRAKAKRRDTYEPRPKLTNEIHIEATGSGMIKPFHTYDEDRNGEEVYGTTTARITTYSVSFVPKDPEKALELKHYVSWALKQIGQMKPAFDIPFDYDSEPYKRPERVQEWSDDKPFYKNTHVNITEEGYVQPATRLDLDDVWNLYYLLEDIIEPSEQIAAAMNAARYAEERGMLMQKADPSSRNKYSNTNMRPESQMGSLDQENPEDYVPAMMQHSLSLYALGEIDEEQFLQRTTVLAGHTLTGKMVDPDGALPTFNRLVDHSKLQEGGAVITYDQALKERTRDLVMMTTETEGDRPLFPALIKKVSEISRPLRAQLREASRQREEEFRSSRYASSSSYAMSLQDLHDEVAEPLNDIEEHFGKFKSDDYIPPTEEEIKQAEQDKKRLAYKANIVLRDSEIGATTDRTWRGTAYVSRSGGSLWVRKDLPAALKPFIRDEAQPDMKDVLNLLMHET